MINNDLLFLSGNDIPFVEGSVTIHQPRLYEIAYVGEETLFIGCEVLKFSKDMLTDEDQTRLSNYDDFDILMSIINDNSGSLTQNVSCAQMVLDLLFPLYTVIYTPVAIAFALRENPEEIVGALTRDNFSAFKDVLNAIFCLKRSDTEEYNAQGELAKKIANKFKKRKQKLAELKQKPDKVAIFSRYISILAVGEHKDMNTFMNYTVYQLFDEFERYQLKEAHDSYIKVKLAGATDVKEPEDWQKDLH